MNALENARGRRSRIVTQWEARRLLASLDIPVVRETLVFTRAEATVAAREMGYPVVIRRWSPRGDAGLETDSGLRDEVSVAHAYDRWSRGGRGDGEAGLLVQETLRDERPLRAVFRADGVDGASVQLGIGGVFRHLVRDEVIRPVPLAREDVRDMIESLRAARLLGAYRGLPPLSLGALADLLERLGRVRGSFPEISEIRMESILARGELPVCLDARVVLA